MGTACPDSLRCARARVRVSGHQIASVLHSVFRLVCDGLNITESSLILIWKMYMELKLLWGTVENRLHGLQGCFYVGFRSAEINVNGACIWNKLHCKHYDVSSS